MWERPVVLAPMATIWSPKEVVAMETHLVSKLSKNYHDKFFELSSNQPDGIGEIERVHQIIATNAFGIYIPESKHLNYYSAVFPILSRCNHE